MRCHLKEATPQLHPALSDGISEDTLSELIAQVAFPGLYEKLIGMIDEQQEELSKKLSLACIEKENRIIAQ